MKVSTLAKLIVLLATLAGLGLMMLRAGAAAQRLDPASWGGDHVNKPAPDLYGGDECLFCHRATVGAVWQNDPHYLAVRDKFQGGKRAPEIEALAARSPFKKAAGEVDFVLGHKRAERFLRRNDRGGFDLLSV